MDPLGIGKIINDKFAQIGENVLGTVIDQIVDNSSAHLSSLNDFQSVSWCVKNQSSQIIQVIFSPQ